MKAKNVEQLQMLTPRNYTAVHPMMLLLEERNVLVKLVQPTVQ